VLPVTAAIELLVPYLGIVGVACWTLLCVWLGFRMGRQVVMPQTEKVPRMPVQDAQNVEIDKTHDDPWEEALHEPPEKRITGDLQ